MNHALLQHEQAGYHGERHMSVPGLPFSGLTVRQTDMAFAILKSPFDPIPLRQLMRQGRVRRLCRRMAQAVVDLVRRIKLLTDQ